VVWSKDSHHSRLAVTPPFRPADGHAPQPAPTRERRARADTRRNAETSSGDLITRRPGWRDKQGR
jgi:hypothetical protein